MSTVNGWLCRYLPEYDLMLMDAIDSSVNATGSVVYGVVDSEPTIAFGYHEDDKTETIVSFNIQYYVAENRERAQKLFHDFPHPEELV